MAEREKIEVKKIKGNWLTNGAKKEEELTFVFNAEPNVVEKIQIKNEAAELLGGIEKIISLENHAFTFYDKHIQFNNEKYGEEEFKNKLAEVTKLANPKTDEEITAFNKLYKEIFKNQYYDMYIGLIEDRMRVGEYAFLKVMCIDKPDGFEFFQQTETELLKITGMVNERRKFFRQQAEQAKTTVVVK
jgi:hypothetical protein